jgi:uncharacterized protein (TIGR02996 family)
LDQEQAFLKGIRQAPHDDSLRLVYADWLEEQGDERAMFVRVHVKLRGLAPDHPLRDGLEQELSRWRKGSDREWLIVAEPERAHLYAEPMPRQRARCGCMQPGRDSRWHEVELHREPQDTECDPWKRLCDLIEEAAADGRTEFAPLSGLDLPALEQIVTLPRSIAKLKAVERLDISGSALVRIPPEIGEMASLKYYDAYGSYRLHWLPYEITRCAYLDDSKISTRALYGNHKYRPPFPALGEETISEPALRHCSVCGEAYLEREEFRMWTTQGIATDALPLLVNACSRACIDRLHKPPNDYVKHPHRGGPNLNQPGPRFTEAPWVRRRRR